MLDPLVVVGKIDGRAKKVSPKKIPLKSYVPVDDKAKYSYLSNFVGEGLNCRCVRL